MTKVKKLYASSSGFAFGESYFSEYNSACMRYIVASHGSPKKPIDPKYSELGLIHEEWWAKHNKGNIKDREVPIKKSYDGVEYSSRVDFINNDGSITETKASMSKSFLYSTIRKKQVKTSHLAQIVSYMIHLQVTKGTIVVGYYKEGSGAKEPQEHVVFNIEINNNGEILVDNQIHTYNVADQLKFLLVLADLYKHDKIHPQRPMSLSKWTNPCTYCPLSELCDQFDQNTILEGEYKDKAKQILIKESVK